MVNAREFLMLGGCSIQITTAVMQYGYRIVEDLKSGLNLYLKEKGYDHVKEVIGLGLDTLSAATDILEGIPLCFRGLSERTASDAAAAWFPVWTEAIRQSQWI